MTLQESIARLSIEQYNSLPKTGKPTTNQWTVLSTIVKEHKTNLEVVALGTGSKCIGKTKMCPSGTVVNDSHAEVICRRAFLRYLYNELGRNAPDLFTLEESKFELKPEVKFHFFTTCVPCGDAAIFPNSVREEVGDEIPSKRMKFDIYRTGAKCLPEDSKQDLKCEGQAYHTVGLVRTKPGRGDPTASVSCSDKLAKWTHLGIQGALLMHFLKHPVYLSSFVILNDTPFCPDSLQRALYGRLGNVNLVQPYQRQKMEIFTVALKFVSKEGKVPCPSSIAWWGESEVVVNGRKQGVTKKTKKGKNLKISKLELFNSFMGLKKKLHNCNENYTYLEAKMLSETYQTNWKLLKESFKVWTRKNPNLQQFN